MIRRGWLVLVGVCAIYFFASAATFQSLGVVVFAMAAEFGWSEAAAGGSFLALGLACCASSLLPAVLIPRIGGRLDDRRRLPDPGGRVRDGLAVLGPGQLHGGSRIVRRGVFASWRTRPGST